jgi:mannitol 2-dehydrogenase
VDEAGDPIEIVDRRRELLASAASQQGEDRLAFLRNRDLFGDLVDSKRFTTEYVAALDALHSDGARTTLERWEG